MDVDKWRLQTKTDAKIALYHKTSENIKQQQQQQLHLPEISVIHQTSSMFIYVSVKKSWQFPNQLLASRDSPSSGSKTLGISSMAEMGSWLTMVPNMV